VLTPEQFHRAYPRYRDLLEIKRRLDPEGLFVSDLARRVGIDPRVAPPAESVSASPDSGSRAAGQRMVGPARAPGSRSGRTERPA